MVTLYLLINTIFIKQFKKLLKIQTINSTIAISILMATVLLLMVEVIMSANAEEIENEVDGFDNGVDSYINSLTNPSEELQTNPYGEPEMTYAEKKAKNDPEYAKLLQHNKKLYEKEHPGWQNEPKNELDSIYTAKKVKPYDNNLGKATIPFLGAWEESKIADHELTYCIDDSVNAYLEGNIRNAFHYWASKLYKIDKENAIGFQGTTLCDKADILITYEHSDNEDGFNAITYTSDNPENIIYDVEMVLYPNEAFQREGYDYEPSLKFGELPQYHGGNKDGPSDGAYYKGYYNVIKHEVGHVLGLDHADNENYLMYDTGQWDRNYDVSSCELGAVIKKNVVERDLYEIICEPS